MEIFFATFPFSGGSGLTSWCAQLYYKSQSTLLHHAWCQLFRLSPGRVSGRNFSIHLITHQQQLSIRQSTTPHPITSTDQISRLIGGQADMLFQELEHMLNRETPQIHETEIFQSDSLVAAPEQPHRTFVTGWT